MICKSDANIRQKTYFYKTKDIYFYDKCHI